MVDFSRFSLGQVQIQIERYTGSYTDGIYSRTLETTINTWGSAQPFVSVETDLISLPERGEDVEKYLILYLQDEIFMNDAGDPDRTASDLLVIDGRKWKPIQVQNWGFGTLSHYRAVIKLYDGY